VSYEVGHNLGFNYDGINTSGYYGGTTPTGGLTSWAPLMGTGYNRAVSTWSRGDYPLANNFEDDVAVLRWKLGGRADTVGNVKASASLLSINSGTNAVAQHGIIEQNLDVDVYYFTTSALGAVTITATPFINPEHTSGNNLDIRLELKNAIGDSLYVDEKTTTCIAEIRALNLVAGTYYLFVSATGNTVTPFDVWGDG